MNSTKTILNDLKNNVNQWLGFHEDGTPRINYGPCGVFAKLFYEAWNNRFGTKVHIVFIMTPNLEECWHIAIRLPSGELYDGGVGIHSEDFYDKDYIFEDMKEYNELLLEKWAYGLDRDYPRFCPDFNKEKLENLINNYLDKLYEPECTIQLLSLMDIDTLFASFKAHNWHKPKSIFEQYLQEQTNNDRKIWLAFDKQVLAGYVTLKWKSNYQPFLDCSIPEIMDLNVLPPFRNKGIGSLLLETAENEVRTKANIVGLGVGLYKDYGQAQKLYFKRGYIPDGRGITYDYKPIEPGSMVCLDDDLVLWFTKHLK